MKRLALKRCLRLTNRVLLSLCAIAGLGAPGCQQWIDQLRGPGFREEFSKMGSDLRPQEDAEHGKDQDRFSFSNKARQIEKNVGY